MYLRLSEDVTVGIERTTFTKVVVASATTKDVTMNLTFIEFDGSPTSFVNTLKRTNTVVRSSSINNTTTNSCNLTTSEESVAHVTTIHLHVSDIHTTVVNIAATEDTTTIEQTIGTIARPCLIVQFLLIVVFLIRSSARPNLKGIEVTSRCRIKMTITDKALVERNIRGSEYGTTLTTTVGITLDSGNTVKETGTVELTDDDVCLTEDVTRRAFADGSSMIAYTTLPATTIDVTCCTTFDIGIGRSDEIIIEIILRNIVFIVHRTYGTGGIEVLRYLTTQQGDVGCSVHIASICSICITEATTIGVGTAQASIIHITTDISTLVDDNVGIVFLAVSGYCQVIVQSGVGIAISNGEVDMFCRCAGSCGSRICSSICFCCPCIHRLLVHHAS